MSNLRKNTTLSQLRLYAKLAKSHTPEQMAVQADGILEVAPDLAKGDVVPFPTPPKSTQPAPSKPATVTPIANKLESRKKLARTRVQATLNDAMDIMGSDPGFQELARKRNVAAKADKLKAGPQLFKPGQTVSHIDQASVPWQGRVTAAEYRENDIDGPGHYYNVKWWNPKLNQYHEDYLHQDSLRPPTPAK
jgi:hypothetical protein